MDAHVTPHDAPDAGYRHRGVYVDAKERASLEMFIAAFVAKYNAKQFGELDQVAPGSHPVILLQDWTGHRVAGEFHQNLEDLFSSIKWNVVWRFAKLGQGQLEWSTPRRARCENDPPPRGGLVYGRFRDDTALLRWKYARAGRVEYESKEEATRAAEMSSMITHFIRDDDLGLGLFLRKEPDGWRIVAVDMLTSPC